MTITTDNTQTLYNALEKLGQYEAAKNDRMLVLEDALLRAHAGLTCAGMMVAMVKGEEGIQQLLFYCNQIEKNVAPYIKFIEKVLEQKA